jgi:hypothetical protein
MRRIVRRIPWMPIWVVLSLAVPAQAQNYVGGATLAEMRTQPTYTFVGLSAQPANTCTSWAAHFQFNHTTADGKALLASLLMARATGRQIAVWYTNSAAPGTVDSACSGNLSVLTGVRVY